MTFLHSDAEISRDGLRDMVETVALVSCTLSQLYALRFVKVCEGALYVPPILIYLLRFVLSLRRTNLNVLNVVFKPLIRFC